MKKRRSVDVTHYFHLNLKLLSFCGLKCSMTETVGTFANKIPTYIMNVLGFICFIFEINFLTEAARLRNTSLMAKIFCQLISNVQSFVKGYMLAVAIDKVQIILYTIRNLWEEYPADKEIAESVCKTADQTLTFCKCYVTANFCCLVSYVLPPAVHLFMQYQDHVITNKTYDLPRMILLVKYPFEVTNIPTFAILALFEELLLVMSVTFWAASDTLFAQVTTHVCIQFKVLKRDIVQIFNSNDSNDKQTLLTLVRRHRELLRICALIEEIFSPIIFFTVFLSSLNLCVNTIGSREIILKKSYFDGGIYATIFLMTIFQIFFFCVFAEKLTGETRSLADAVYNLNWTAKDYKLRFYLQFIIIRAQKPFYCTAYGFFPIGHQQLTSIIRTSFSYYMMLTTTEKK